MTALAALVAACERIGDRCNAILVKEVRQSLKSRQFVATFFLLLIASWAGSIIGVAYEGTSIEYGAPAEGFFGGFFLVLSIAALVIVPFTAFRSIVEERAEHTLDLVQITALSPRQIVWGKLSSAIVQLLVYYSAIAPFIAFTALLPGFDFRQVVVALVLLLIASISFSLAALAIGAQVRQKAAQVLTTVVIVVMAIGGLSACYSLILLAAGAIRFDDAATWWTIGLGLFGVVSTGILCQEATVAQLTFESDNRSSAMRIIIVVQWLFYWTVLVVHRVLYGSAVAPEEWAACFPMTALYIFASSLYFLGEPDPLSRRISRGLPRSRAWRLAWTPFLPGGTRGLLYGLLSLGALVAIAMPLRATAASSRTFGDPAMAWCAVLYIVIILCLGALCSRFLGRVMETVRAGHIVALLAVILVVSTALSLAIRYLLDLRARELSPIDLFNPILTLSLVADGLPGTDLAVVVLGVAAAAAAAANLSAIRKAVRDIVYNPVRREIEERVAAAHSAAGSSGATP